MHRGEAIPKPDEREDEAAKYRGSHVKDFLNRL